MASWWSARLPTRCRSTRRGTAANLGVSRNTVMPRHRRRASIARMAPYHSWYRAGTRGSPPWCAVPPADHRRSRSPRTTSRKYASQSWERLCTWSAFPQPNRPWGASPPLTPPRWRGRRPEATHRDPGAGEPCPQRGNIPGAPASGADVRQAAAGAGSASAWQRWGRWPA